jgi:hypothetical protein
MKLYIPTLGTRLVLKKSWKFPLYYEIRNERLFESKLGKRVCRPHWSCKSKPLFGLESLDNRSNHNDLIYDAEDRRYIDFLKEQANGEHNLRLVGDAYEGFTPCIDVTFPKGTVLTYNGIYTRQRSKAPSFVSFHAKEPESSRPVRFRTVLNDANGLEVVEVSAEPRLLAPAPNFGLFFRPGSAINC